jgi:hypothetical protein
MAEGSLPVRIPGMTGRIHGMSQANEDALAILQRDWGTRYLVSITRPPGGDLTWQAARIGTTATFSLTADTPEDLNAQMAKDNGRL